MQEQNIVSLLNQNRDNILLYRDNWPRRIDSL